MALARYGIVNGKRVALAELVPPLMPSLLDSFSAEALKQAGFLGIAEKVVSDTPLDPEDLILLLSQAGLPALMKLVSLKKKEVSSPTVTPAVVLPLSLWLNFDSDLVKVAALADQFLKDIPYSSVSVSFDRIDLKRLDSRLVSFFKTVSRCRDGISMVGPRIEEVFQFVEQCSAADSAPRSVVRMSKVRKAGELSKVSRLDRVKEILLLLKSSGFERLMAFSSDQFLGLSSECGFSNSFVTDVEHFRTTEALAQELVRIKERASSKRWLDVWSPGSDVMRTPTLREDPVTELKLLRVLAVGSLYFDNRPQVRASSRYLSADAILFARQLGADDLGFGAFDSFTKKTLSLRSFDEIERIIQSH